MAAPHRRVFGFKYQEKERENTLFSNDNRILLRRQPGAAQNYKLRVKHSSAQVLCNWHPSLASPGDGLLSRAGSQRDEKLRGKLQLLHMTASQDICLQPAGVWMSAQAIGSAQKRKVFSFLS